MVEQPSAEKNINISRRMFIGFVTGAGIGSLLGIAIGNPLYNIIFSKKSEAQVIAENGARLSQTATIVVGKGEQTSFTEEAGFTKKMVEEARQGIFLLKIDGETKKGEGATLIGTAWVAKTEKNSLYLATAGHSLTKLDSIYKLAILRPNIDKDFLQLAEVKTKTLPENMPDIAVIKCQKPQTERPITALNYQPYAQIKKGERLLVIGYPGEFLDKQDITKSITSASIVTITTNPNQEAAMWEAEGLSNPGASGSPLIQQRDGKLIVVGINTLGSESSIAGYQINIDQLIREM